ncbi:MAG: glycosyltransferase family 4 protein [Candidatus Pacebacteria bacterium]|nr:glycosyltransferase family 4 protein [Candidatus Paceibacterota bacterium]MBP9832183.1 glycosyltransferase family 4 protein [Candidatus Paceibacterota bacterium]
MKLLLVTQIVDKDDPILGFFHRWIEEFAKHVESIEVICLKEGKHELPSNVRVHSIGKEQGGGNAVLYSIRFLYLVWMLRKEYEKVLVHMNPEYVVLAGCFWKLWHKPIRLWYNHPHAGVRLAIASVFSDIIFHTSAYAAPAHLRKAKCMPAGIDVDVFKPQAVTRNRHLMYMQGRIMPSKRVAIALQALRILRKNIPDVTLMLVGPEDPVYGASLRKEYADLVESGAVLFKGSVPNHETPLLYSGAGVSINLATSGHFDKSVLESMACGTPVVISSKAFANLVPEEWIVSENDPQALADGVGRMMGISDAEFEALQQKGIEVVQKAQSLKALSEMLIKAL